MVDGPATESLLPFGASVPTATAWGPAGAAGTTIVVLKVPPGLIRTSGIPDVDPSQVNWSRVFGGRELPKMTTLPPETPWSGEAEITGSLACTLARGKKTATRPMTIANVATTSVARAVPLRGGAFARTWRSLDSSVQRVPSQKDISRLLGSRGDSVCWSSGGFASRVTPGLPCRTSCRRLGRPGAAMTA
jgi:hypothetical protein